MTFRASSLLVAALLAATAARGAATDPVADTECTTKGDAFLADCKAAIDASTTECPQACTDAHTALKTYVDAAAGNTCLLAPLGDATALRAWKPWRWSAELDIQLNAKAAAIVNPCAFADMNTCEKKFMMAAEFGATFQCEQTCSAKCQADVDSFYTDCSANDAYVGEDGTTTINNQRQGLMVALMNKCVDFTNGDHPTTSATFCTEENLTTGVCPLLAEYRETAADLIDTACSLDVSILVALSGPAGAIMLAGLGGGDLGPALTAGITGIGPCITKLGTTGTVTKLCPTACAAPAPAPTPPVKEKSIAPADSAAVRGAAASSGIALVVAAAAASAM